MDITLVNASIYHLPTSHRAQAIVYGGPNDLTLWRPPGPDRELWDAYGEDLQDVLDKEAEGLEAGTLDDCGVVRLHPGKLHCDFLIWVACQGAHGDAQPAIAPNADMIQRAAAAVLAYAGTKDVSRLAFPALGGGGRNALGTAERVAAVVQAVQAYKRSCFDAGQSAGIEDVVICEANSAALNRGRHLLSASGLGSTRIADVRPAANKKVPKKPARARTTAPRRPKGLTAEAVAQAHSSAAAYDRSAHYLEGEWFIHPRFGAGLVQEVQPDKRIVVVFEDGSERTMMHARE